MTTANVVPLRTMSAADRLEAFARKPLAPHRFELRMLADRLRALDAPTDVRVQHGQLDLFGLAA